jgi:hypothetical protein
MHNAFPFFKEQGCTLPGKPCQAPLPSSLTIDLRNNILYKIVAIAQAFPEYTGLARIPTPEPPPARQTKLDSPA